MDSSYWEQLQYTGDTRLEMLISYAVSGDPRLAEQAIEAFAETNVDGGLVAGRTPAREDNVIAPFSFAWVGMLADWSMEQPDAALIQPSPAAHARGARLVRALAQPAADCWARIRIGISSTGPASAGTTATTFLRGERTTAAA